MTRHTKIIRKMRVFEFEVETPDGATVPLLAIDRDDGLRVRLEMAFGTKAKKECRPRNIGLMIDKEKHKLVVTNAENAGYASTEIMKILNQTGFTGEVWFLTNGNSYPLHLLRRLNKLALDFDLGTCSVATLLSKLNSTTHSTTQNAPQTPKMTSALG